MVSTEPINSINNNTNDFLEIRITYQQPDDRGFINSLITNCYGGELNLKSFKTFTQTVLEPHKILHLATIDEVKRIIPGDYFLPELIEE